MVAIAQRRARERTGVNFDNDHIVLVGDTPKDVEAALTAGVRVIAVATGETTVEQRRAAGAETVLRELDLRTVVDALDQPNSTS
ncbi:HAD hydrolase-like protein [Kibdelosporangium lantanae]|uniref:HAD hydrolase-like protein n=1 Tax=Kibdelosporangium lantanae TaxID=1497396 RepID=A0ABW3M658_9PSEU